jgi:oxygen-independent coproporphyrinogen-3 oxidase
VPFCARACPYCDFDFEVGPAPEIDLYLAGLDEEWAGREDAQALVRPATLYIGGGTPSRLGAEGLGRLLSWVERRFPEARLTEVTVEINPEDAGGSLLSRLRDRGVDRVSIGVQTLDPEGLRLLGRAHDAEVALSALARAREVGLRTSADLIVGCPGQSESRLRSDLGALVSAGAGHLSVYALTVEPGTAWARLVRLGRRAAVDADRQADLLSVAEATLTAAGFEHYEISSYALPGQRSRHNVGYWTWADYVGLGPSAASARFDVAGVQRRTNRRGLSAWRAAPAQAAEREDLHPEAAGGEGLWTGLRLLEGVALDRFRHRFPALPPGWLDERTGRHVSRGNLLWTGDRLRLAAGKWLLLDAIAVDLLA